MQAVCYNRICNDYPLGGWALMCATCWAVSETRLSNHVVVHHLITKACMLLNQLLIGDAVQISAHCQHIASVPAWSRGVPFQDFGVRESNFMKK
jgi:hypothetical protein